MLRNNLGRVSSVRGSISGSQGSCCPKGCGVCAADWQLCSPAAVGVQGHPRHTCASPKAPPGAGLRGASSALAVPAAPRGAMGGRCDFQSQTGLQVCETAADQPQPRFCSMFQCEPWQLCLVKGKLKSISVYVLPSKN